MLDNDTWEEFIKKGFTCKQCAFELDCSSDEICNDFEPIFKCTCDNCAHKDTDCMYKDNQNSNTACEYWDNYQNCGTCAFGKFKKDSTKGTCAIKYNGFDGVSCDMWKEKGNGTTD